MLKTNSSRFFSVTTRERSRESAETLLKNVICITLREKIGAIDFEIVRSNGGKLLPHGGNLSNFPTVYITLRNHIAQHHCPYKDQFSSQLFWIRHLPFSFFDLLPVSSSFDSKTLTSSISISFFIHHRSVPIHDPFATLYLFLFIGFF